MKKQSHVTRLFSSFSLHPSSLVCNDVTSVARRFNIVGRASQPVWSGKRADRENFLDAAGRFKVAKVQADFATGGAKVR